MEKSSTERGFPVIEFKDSYGSKCSLQNSSSAAKPKIWLGVDDANPQIMAKSIMEDGVGWVKCPMPEGVTFTTRMHLTRSQVADLIPHLQNFVDTGEI
jgi:hypothetical protein